ncbi:unnamed protein product [Rotaria socialis]|uniref:Vesicle tethering protein Uso1/P115-like head domain-containing protein n=2 Tax=Rotaria socialis TaxID=392032 RepID=A0A821IT32_9BILA|nr:unnamed protein product [Rotaria socialis]
MPFWSCCSLFSSTKPFSTTNNNNTISQEAIENLCNHLQTANRVEDRRHILRALKSLSKKYKLEVGTQSIGLLGNILHHEKNDLKLVQLILDTLINLTAIDSVADGEQLVLSHDMSIQFTKSFINNKEHVHLILELITATDLNIRRTAIRLFTVLLSKCTKQLQGMLLGSGRRGFSNLFGLLKDECEVIPNNALPLFEILTRSNKYIQGIVAIENGFQCLLRILVDENSNDGNIAVGDCLCILLNLLEDNEIIRTFVSLTNSAEHIVACQTTIEQCGILRRLCIILMLTTTPADILAETIRTIGDVMRGDAKNQRCLDLVMNTNTKIQQPVLFNLLYVMICGEEKSFSLRISVLYCLQCYLHKNESGKSMIVQALLAQTKSTANQHSMGHLLRSGYLSEDAVASWCSGILLSHLIVNSPQSKQDILKAKLALDRTQTNAKTLMEISIDILHKSSSSFHIRVAVIILICTWLPNCSLAVQELVSIPNSISYLVSQICAQSIEDDR